MDLSAIRGEALDLLRLPRQHELREYVTDDLLDPTDPLTVHVWSAEWAERVKQSEAWTP